VERLQLFVRDPFIAFRHHRSPRRPTAGLVGIDRNLLYVLVIIRLARRELAWINVTPHPTAKWIAQQITEAFPWNEAPRYLIRDRDAIYGAAVAGLENRSGRF
jgi:hypothetical protein